MSSKASAFAELLQSSLSSRTVYVKCIPAPASFYERRAVLRAVQQISGETVETFKKLEDDSSFVVVTTKPDTATALVNDSPVTRVVIAQDPNAAEAPKGASWGAEYDMRGSITTPVNPLPPLKATQPTPAFSDLGLSHRTFTLHMFAANKTYNHKEVVSKNPLHGPWPSNGSSETFVSAALRKSIPSGAMAPALRDWHTASQLDRDSTSFADEGSEGAAAVLLGKKRLSSEEVYLMERIRARWNAKKIPAVMKGLANFANGNTPDQPSTLDPLPDTHDLRHKLDDLVGNPDLVKDAEPLLGSATERVHSDPSRSVGTSDGTEADESKPK
ncbi:hypothetical protein F5Y04DRAFT_74575 [Hypomontagnella monticulosa]|nr:hypothetical protein F5Y04DRAFT_74575 [Hypomontagnella monticulosa]